MYVFDADLPFSEANVATKVIEGQSDFTLLIKADGKYLDKSFFINKFLNTGPKCLLILRPPGFGKSLNLSMLRYFLDEQISDQGVVFNKLSVMQDSSIVRDHMGKHPVVFLSLKGCTASSWATMRREIWDALVTMCRPFIKTDEKTFFGDLINSNYLGNPPSAFPENVTDVSLRRVFVRLVDRVHRISGKSVIVLIDDYDTPFGVSFADASEDEKRLVFFRSFFSAVLKDNPKTYRACLTGVFEVRLSTLWSGLDNLTVVSVANDPVFTDCFGLSETEMRNFLVSQMHKPVEMSGELCEYYGGYFGCQKLVTSNNFFKYIMNGFRITPTIPEGLFEYVMEQDVYLDDVIEVIFALTSRHDSLGKRSPVGRIDPTLPPQGSRLLKGQLPHLLCMTGYLTYESVKGEVWIPNMGALLEWKRMLAKIYGYNSIDDLKTFYRGLANALSSFDEILISFFIKQATTSLSPLLGGNMHLYERFIRGIIDHLDLGRLCGNVICFDGENRSVTVKFNHCESRKRCLGKIFHPKRTHIITANHNELYVCCVIRGRPEEGIMDVECVPITS